jgi:hypothetical protein
VNVREIRGYLKQVLRLRCAPLSDCLWLSSVFLALVVGWLMEKTARMRLGKREERVSRFPTTSAAADYGVTVWFGDAAWICVLTSLALALRRTSSL